MAHSLPDRTLALAGLFQAASLVQQVARRGSAPPSDIETCINSLFRIDAASTTAVFGDVRGVALGLRTLRDRLGAGGTAEQLEVTRYAIALLHLERKLVRSPALLDKLRAGIERAQAQATYFSPTHESVIAALGALYQSTISTLQPRVMVQGEPAYLADNDRASLIRALLLAGIRAAVLWRQLGGNRWQLFFQRRRIIDSAEELLSSAG